MTTAPGDILVHIGYPKTGSTWLQTHLFARPETGFGLVDRALVRKAIVKPPPLQFDAETCANLLEPPINAIRATGRTPVISLESLVGEPKASGYNANELCDRLATVFPRGHYVIVLREQKSLIWSLYQQMVMGPATLPDPLLQLLAPRSGNRLQRALAPFNWHFFEFHWLVDRYLTQFGRDRVTIRLYEHFKAAPAQFAADLLAHSARTEMGIVNKLPFNEIINRGVSPITVALKRRANRFVGRRNHLNRVPLFAVSWQTAMRFWKIWRGLDRLLPQNLRQRTGERNYHLLQRLVRDRFRASNRLTIALTGLPLAEDGYDV